MRRLYLQVYLTIVASLVLVVLTAGLLWHFFAGFGPFGQQFEVAGEVIAELVPAANAPAAAQQQAIDRLAERLEAFDRSIDVHMSRIRAAIEDDPKKPRRVITVRGAGYVFAKVQD